MKNIQLLNGKSTEQLKSWLGWEDVGRVIAPGIWTAGSIKGTRYAKEAYELGKRL